MSINKLLSDFIAQPVRCPTDIVFVLDGSGSIGVNNFTTMKSFVSRLIARMDINSGNTRVGIITFSSSVGTYFNLNSHATIASLQAAISSLNYSGGSTYTDAALAFVRTTMLISAAGDRSNVPNVVVILTDGHSSDESSTLVSIQYDYLEFGYNAKDNTSICQFVINITCPQDLRITNLFFTHNAIC